MYKDLRDQNTIFSGLLASFNFSASLAYQGETERGNGELVSGNYFETLGVGPAIGRVFTPEDDLRPGAQQVAVLSHKYWTNRLGANPAVLNRSILVNGNPMTIVGVAQRGFFGVEISAMPDVFVPMMMRKQLAVAPRDLTIRNDHWLHMLGRLKPGVSRIAAAAALQPVFSNILRVDVDELKMSGKRREQYLQRKIMVVDGAIGRGILSNDTSAPLIALMGMVGLVLLIACANVANLLLARAAARQKEIAVRLAIGASRWQLIRQLLVESILLGLIGGLVGLLTAAWTLEALFRFMQQANPASINASLDGRTLVFHFALAVAAGIVFGLAPALQGTRPDLAPVLKDQSGAVGAGTGNARIRQVLVVAQMALTLLLVTGAGLFAKSLLELRNVNLGMKTSHVDTFAVEPKLNGYSMEATRDFARRLQLEIAALPGVQAVSFSNMPIFRGSDEGSNITAEGYASSPDSDDNVKANRLGPGYLATLGIPLIAGREFTEADSSNASLVCMINEKTAAKFFPGRNPIGLHIAFGAGKGIKQMEIVGLVKNSLHQNVRDKIDPYVYAPFAQSDGALPITVYVRTVSDPAAMLDSLRQTVRRLDQNLPVFQTVTLDAQVDESLIAERMLAILTTALGGLAVLLAILGIYGLLAYVVARRTREIGLRMALGAGAPEVRWLVVKDVGKMVLAGTAIGLPAAYALGRFSQSLLFGVAPVDLTVTLVALTVLFLVALAGAYFPTRRATKIDPMIALRTD
jgi:predicted permease